MHRLCEQEEPVAGPAQDIHEAVGGDGVDLLLLNTDPLWLCFRVADGEEP